MARTRAVMKSLTRCVVPGLEHKWIEVKLLALDMASATLTIIISVRPVPCKLMCYIRLLRLMKTHRDCRTYLVDSGHETSLAYQSSSAMLYFELVLLIFNNPFGYQFSTICSFGSTRVFQDRLSDRRSLFSPRDLSKLM